MASYSTVRTMKALPIGSVQPWVGPLTRIPKGWLLCNGNELEAANYPLLARILKDTYGGTNFNGSFPNYTGTFRLPPTNQRGLADIDVQYFSNDTTTSVNGETVDRPAPIDNLEALNVLSVENDFIAAGVDGSLSAPTTVFAITDLLFSYTPDPDGFIAGIEIDFENSGPAPYFTQTTTFTNVQAVGGSAGANDDKATFRVVIAAGEDDGVTQTPGIFDVRKENSGEGYEAGDILTIPGNSIGGITGVNDILITVTSVGDGFFTGQVSGQSIINGFEIKPVYVVGRKLSRRHFPQHFHEGTYRTINKNDVSTNPGTGVGVYQNATIEVTEFWIDARGRTFLGAIDDTDPPELDSVSNVWQGRWTLSSSGIGADTISFDLGNPFTAGKGRYAIAAINGDPDIPRSNRVIATATDAHGVGKAWFNNLWSGANLRDGNNNTSINADPTTNNLAFLKQYGKFRPKTAVPFSDETELQLTPNFDDGQGTSEGLLGYTNTLYNTAGLDYTKNESTDPLVNDVILAHDHNGSFNVEYDDSALNIKPQITVRVQPNITPDNIENAFQITYNVPSPSLAVIHLIRSY